MTLINVITDDTKQNINLILADGSRIDMSLRFVSNQEGWYYDFVYTNIIGNTFTVNGKRIVNSPNMLRAFASIIPFGFACTVTDGQEPVFVDDFSSKRASFYLLDANDIVAVQQDIFAV